MKVNGADMKVAATMTTCNVAENRKSLDIWLLSGSATGILLLVARYQTDSVNAHYLHTTDQLNSCAVGNSRVSTQVYREG